MDLLRVQWSIAGFDGKTRRYEVWLRSGILSRVYWRYLSATLFGSDGELV
jgi:hypothetical protein